MTIRDPDEWEVMAEAWNRGIDAHLEALTERSSADASTGKVRIHPDEVQTLVRRLWERHERDGNEEARTLRSDILTALELEEV